MAWTHIAPITASPGKSAANTMRDCIKYGLNPEKTDNGRLVSTHGCTADAAHKQFLFTKQYYHLIGGRKMPSDKDVLLYHLKQSFKPGEVSPEEANRIGHETALRFTGSKHAFVVATHIDRGHAHNHIYFNAVQMDADKKFRNFKLSFLALQRASDHICLENGLSIIKNPGQRSESKEYTAQIWKTKQQSHLSNREILRDNIDQALAKQPEDFKKFMDHLKNDFGWQIARRGRTFSLSHKDFKQSIRLTQKSLGEGYCEKSIKDKIAGQRKSERMHTAGQKEHDKTHTVTTPEYVPAYKMYSGQQQTPSHTEQQPGNILMQLQSAIKSQLSAGYKNKDAINALSYLNQKGIDTMEKLDKQLEAAANMRDKSGDALIKTDRRLEEIDELLAEIKNYSSGAAVYAQYTKLRDRQPTIKDKLLGSSDHTHQFFEDNRASITLYETARDYFVKHGYGKSKGKPVPHPDNLKAQRAALSKERAGHSESYHKYNFESRELSKAKDALSTELNRHNGEQSITRSRGQPDRYPDGHLNSTDQERILMPHKHSETSR